MSDEMGMIVEELAKVVRCMPSELYNEEAISRILELTKEQVLKELEATTK